MDLLSLRTVWATFSRSGRATQGDNLSVSVSLYTYLFIDLFMSINIGL